jgi:hypothetical protein
MGHSLSHLLSDFLADARHLGYQGELEIIGLLVVIGLLAGAYALATILLGYSLS